MFKPSVETDILQASIKPSKTSNSQDQPSILSCGACWLAGFSETTVESRIGWSSRACHDRCTCNRWTVTCLSKQTAPKFICKVRKACVQELERIQRMPSPKGFVFFASSRWYVSHPIKAKRRKRYICWQQQTPRSKEKGGCPYVQYPVLIVWRSSLLQNRYVQSMPMLNTQTLWPLLVSRLVALPPRPHCSLQGVGGILLEHIFLDDNSTTTFLSVGSMYFWKSSKKSLY